MPVPLQADPSFFPAGYKIVVLCKKKYVKRNIIIF